MEEGTPSSPSNPPYLVGIRRRITGGRHRRASPPSTSPLPRRRPRRRPSPKLLHLLSQVLHG
jgi:hypothetical protein